MDVHEEIEKGNVVPLKNIIARCKYCKTLNEITYDDYIEQSADIIGKFVAPPWLAMKCGSCGKKFICNGFWQ